MSYQNYVAAAASQSMFMKQINEMLSPNSAIFNNPVLTFLMEYISKVRTDSQQFQEVYLVPPVIFHFFDAPISVMQVFCQLDSPQQWDMMLISN